MNGFSMCLWLGMALVSVVTIAVGVLLHPKGVATCGGQPMTPGTYCQIPHGNDTVRGVDQAQLLAEQSQVPTVIIVVGSICLALAVISAVRQRQLHQQWLAASDRAHISRAL